MKKMKKLASLLMAVAMVFSMMATASAASKDGSITVNDTIAGQTYTVYQILVLESFSGEAYSYKATSAWEAWLKTQTEYVAVSDTGYVTFVSGASVSGFAAAAMKFVEENSIPAAVDPVKTEADDEVVKFTNLELGYYLVDSTLGALCALTNTDKDAIIVEKNYEPGIDKKAKNEANNYVEDVNAQIGQIVEFAVKVDIYPGATNYVYHDAMTEGLTYINTTENPTAVYYAPMSEDKELNAEFKKIAGNEEKVAYTVVSGCSTKEHDHPDGITACAFHINFNQEFLDSVDDYTAITVNYYAKLNENAVTNHVDKDGNINYAKLTYGEYSSTGWDPAKVHTYLFEIVKTDNKANMLTGAKFKLYDAATGGNLIPLIKTGEEDGKIIYRIATAEQIASKQQENPAWTTDEIEVGRAILEGVNLHVNYYLEETQSPAGYNLLDGRIKATMTTDPNNSSKVYVNGSDHIAIVEEGVYKSGGLRVVNQAGIVLPETGGIGTTIFYVSGATLALGAIVLFITKRRMED